MVAGGVSKHTTERRHLLRLAQPSPSCDHHSTPTHARHTHTCFSSSLPSSVSVCVSSSPLQQSLPTPLVMRFSLALVSSPHTHPSSFTQRRTRSEEKKRRTRRGHEYVGLMMIGTKASIGRGLWSSLGGSLGDGGGDSSHLFFSYPLLSLLFHRPFGIAPRTV